MSTFEQSKYSSESVDDNSFWESSAYDSASDETDNDTEFSGSTPPHIHSDTDKLHGYDQMPPTKKLKIDETESDDSNRVDAGGGGSRGGQGGCSSRGD